MAAANVITSQAAAATSADFTVTTNAVLCLKGALNGETRVSVQLKDDASAYNHIHELNLACRSVLLYPGVYRAVKGASASVYGCFTG